MTRWRLALIGVWLAGMIPSAVAEAQAPRFLLAVADSGRPPVPIDASQVSALRQRIALPMNDLAPSEALRAIARASGLQVVFESSILSAASPVRLGRDSITVAAALSHALHGSGLDVLIKSGPILVLVPGTTSATTSHAPAVGVVRGRTIDSANAPIADVEISAGDLTTRTRSDGTFELSGLPLGASRLLVRRVGYVPVGALVRFSTPGTLEQTFTLSRFTSLDTVNVTAESRAALYPELERRRRDIERTGIGRFLDDGYLTRAGNTKLSSLLGIEVGFKVLRSNGRAYIISRRMRLTNGGPCFAQVFYDGVRIYAGGRAESPPDIDAFSVFTIQAIELYRGENETPGPLNATGSACGTVAIWSRR